MSASRGTVSPTGADQPVRYGFAGGLAQITLDAADAGNPINADFVATFQAAVRRTARDRARVVLLNARGRFFCVGGDLREVAGADDRVGSLGQLADGLHVAIGELVRSDAIVISAVQGPCAGAGFPLAFAADIVIASESASFTAGYTKVGLSPDGGTSMLVRSLGLHRVLTLALLNETLHVQDAHAAGLVARVVPDADLQAAAQETADRLLAGSAAAQAATKHVLRDTAAADLETVLRTEATAIRVQGAGLDSAEGIDAFLGKRRARFAR